MAFVKDDQNANTTTQLVKQKANLAAIYDDDHNASITTDIEKKKTESYAVTTKQKRKNNTKTIALERSQTITELRVYCGDRQTKKSLQNNLKKMYE